MEFDDGVRHEASARNRNRIQLQHCNVPLLALLRRQALQSLDAIEHPAALLRVHVIEPGQNVEPVFLHLRR